MKDKLEVGMYVRTKWGYICELININDFREPSMKYGVEANYLKDVMFIGDEYILKASHNIIDLIEVGDVIKFDITDTDNYADIQGYNCWEISCEEELNGVKEMIEMESAKLISIVTREQFSDMEYRLGDDK